MTKNSSGEAGRSGARSVKLWAAFLLLIAAALGLAWIGAGSLRPEMSASGLAFREVKAGSGEPIGAADAAMLDYVLTADDGTVIDSSDSHGGPQPLTASQVFPGFAEAMERMQEGGEYRFSMPPALAFGDQGPPPSFPAGSDLNFEVRVRQIVRGGAAMMQQQMMQQQQQQMPPQGEPR
jgi:FKBP-type peptidyl-prolyl cis-trans isomerase FkpA